MFILVVSMASKLRLDREQGVSVSYTAPVSGIMLTCSQKTSPHEFVCRTVDHNRERLHSSERRLECDS